MIEGRNPHWKFQGLLGSAAATAMFAALLATHLILQTALAADTVKAVKPIDTARLPWDLMGLAKLVQSGVSEQVVLAYIKGNPPKRTPTAEEVVYLHELGLTNDGIITLLEAAPKLSQNVATFAPAAPPTTPVAEPAAPVPAATTPAVAPAPAATTTANTVISAPAPTVVYTQPAPTTVYVERPPVVTYVAPYPRISIGFGFGHYWGHHHHWGHHHGHRRWHH